MQDGIIHIRSEQCGPGTERTPSISSAQQGDVTPSPASELPNSGTPASETPAAAESTRIAVYNLAHILASALPFPSRPQDQILERMLQDTLDVEQEAQVLGRVNARSHATAGRRVSVVSAGSAAPSEDFRRISMSPAGSSGLGTPDSGGTRGTTGQRGGGVPQHVSGIAVSDAGTRASVGVSFGALVQVHDDEYGALGRVLSQVGPQGGSWRRREKRIQQAMMELSARLELEAGVPV